MRGSICNKLGAVRENAHGAYARWPEFRAELGGSLRACGSLRLERPLTVVWRWLLPHWTLVTTVLSFGAIAWTFVLLIALKLA